MIDSETHTPDVAGLTNVGKVREENQDQFLIATLHRGMRIIGTSLSDPERLPLTSPAENTLLMVADGVGGTPGGQQASGAALEAVLRFLVRQVTSYFGRGPGQEEPLEQTLQRAALESHAYVRARAEEHPEWAGMSTTLTLVLEVWPAAYVLQVGDSRCYRLRDGRLEQLTRDQTVAAHLVDAGAMGAHTAMRSRWNNVLASSIGGSEAAPVACKIELQPGDRLILSSDGLTKHVPEAKLTEMLGEDRPAADLCQALVDAALEGGGSDNITVAIAKF